MENLAEMHVREAAGLDDTSSIPIRTVFSFTCSIKTSGKWKVQPVQEIGLLEALADPTVADLYWCGVFKFQRDLLLTTPSDAVMTVMLGILEPMCQLEEVLEIGTTPDEDESRQISENLLENKKENLQ
jgi:hypothetical protein